MPLPEEIDLLIVGAGPAGISTALHLLKRDRGWSRRMIVIDKAVHPRPKLCGGGITHIGYNVLATLGLGIGIDSFEVHEARLELGGVSFSLKGMPVFQTVRRDEFDFWLLSQAADRGADIRQGVSLLNLRPENGSMIVETSSGVFRARVVIGADGSKSRVRTRLNWEDDSRVARLLEVLTPEQAESQPEFVERRAVLDFTSISDGLQGYYWDFPSYVEGRPMMNRGLFDSRVHSRRPKAKLKAVLRRHMAERERDLDDVPLHGYPMRWFDRRGRFAIPNVLLAGDAAGTDPLLGEGISFALAYGDAAAQAVVEAFSNNEFDFSNYRKIILNHPVLSQLRTRVALARLVYGVRMGWLLRLLWKGIALLVSFSRWQDGSHVPIREPGDYSDSV